MPSSTCAVSGLSEILCDRTSDSQRVFTNVVRPVPEAPRKTKDREKPVWRCLQNTFAKRTDQRP
jgi:hypothetical protein